MRPRPSPRSLWPVFLLLLAPGTSHAQTEVDRLADLELEDLLSVRLPSMTNVLGGHVHNEGEWMLIVRRMEMRMDGLRDGTNDLATSEVLMPGGDYMVAPLSMDMRMTMLGAMYGMTDRSTLMVMLPYHDRSMDHITMMGQEFTTESRGPGDVRLTALHVGWEDYDRRLIFSGGLSLPTGSINEKDDTPMGPDQLLPYPMQLGSGTFDLAPGMTYVAEYENWGFGAQTEALLRLGRNSHGYSLGDRLTAGVWARRKLTHEFALSTRLVGHRWGNVSGADPGLDPGLVPTADPRNQGGTRVDLGLGLHLYGRKGLLSGNNLDLEVGFPIHEDLDGPQMSAEGWVLLSWSVTF